MQAFLLKLTGQENLGNRLLKTSCQNGILVSCADLHPEKRKRYCTKGIEKACTDEYKKSKDEKMLSKSCQLNNGNSCNEMAQINYKRSEFSLAHLRYMKSCLLGILKSCKNLVLNTPMGQVGETEVNTNLCAKGDLKSCTYLSIAKYNNKKYKTAKKELIQHCKKGDQLACYYSALTTYKLKNKQKAIVELSKFCKKDSPLVCYTLANLQSGKEKSKTLELGCSFKDGQSCYELGRISKSDIHIQREFFSRACLYSNARGCYEAGQILTKSGHRKVAMNYFKKGCILNLAKSCVSLAVISNVKEKKKLLKKACKLGHKKSCPR